ncbi:MAG TPA: AMP-binding protein [Syntrophomonadaceae bacterium]|nr:AMP-binding protein [Syntrophomonadaceae bacterium]
MESLRILDLINTTPEVKPEKIALIGGDGNTLTYGQLNETVQNMSRYLKEQGVGKGQRFAVVLPNCMEMLLAYLTITNVAVFIPLGDELSEEQYQYYCKLLKADSVLIPDQFDSPLLKTAKAFNLRVYHLSRQEIDNKITYNLRGDEKRGVYQALLPHNDDVALVQFTSGTTAEPKIVPRTHRNLFYSTQQRIKEMKLVPEDKVMILAPSHRGITLNETLTVLAVGGTVIYTDKFDAVQFFEQIRKTTPTWILGSPVVFNNIAAYAEKNDLDYGSDELKLIKSAGAPLTEELALRLQNIFNVPVYEGYGLTECGSIAFSMNAPQGYKAGSVGVPVGVDVAVMKETGEMAGYNQPGEILVRGPQVIKGYENDAGRDSFYQGWFRTGDRGYLDEDGYLFVAGRFKEIINRGGEKISPYEVEEAISRHPDILQVAVFPIPMGGGNEEAGAAVVLKEGAALYLKELRRFLYGKVTAFKMPTRLYVLKEMPVGHGGKVQRSALYEAVAALGIEAQPLADAGETIILPRGEIEFKLYKIFLGILQLKEISVTDTFFELGGDSIKTAVLYEQIKEVFGLQIPLKYIFNNGSIENLAEYIAGNIEHGNKHPFIVPFQVHGSKTPIFLIHAAEGEAIMYRHVVMNFDPERPVYGISFDPHGAEWVHPITFEQIAAQYIKDMITIQPEGPYILAAQCVGGLIACEMARQLLEARQKIALLAVFDSILPEAEVKANLDRRLLRNINEIKTQGLIKYLEVKWYYYKRIFYKKLPGAMKLIIFNNMDKQNIIGCARENYRMKKYDGEIVFFKPKYTGNKSLASVELWSKLARDIRIIPTHGDHWSVFFAENAEYTRQVLEEVLADIP